MPYTSDFPEPEQEPSWDSLQRNISDDGLLDVPGITREASQARELVLSTQDSLYENSGLLNEVLEIRRHLERMLDEDLAYTVIEKSLVQMGYQKEKVRQEFHKLTGVDPVVAFLDFSSYPTPPGSVPRFVYGWGKAKSGDGADYYFVLPWIDHYGLFKLTGMERELVSEHDLVEQARDALDKKVSTVMDVTPDMADTLTPHFEVLITLGALSKAGAEAYKKIGAIAKQDPDTASRALVQYHESGEITDTDFRVMARALVAAPLAPLHSPEMSAPERIDEKEFQAFREDQEGRSFREMTQNTLMPGQEFASAWEQSHKVDFWGVLTRSRELFGKIVSTIQGFRIEPSWGTFRVMDQPNLAVDDDNTILDGSVVVGAKVQTADGSKESQVAVLMFIHNGKLRYSGKFKGANEREYALTTQGLNEYFDDLEGTTALDEQIGMGGGEMRPQETNVRI